jgi:CRISPR/Cas system-associated exonuclease Cas4 (RecB family)
MNDMRQLEHVSFSSINTFLRCSEKFNLRYFEHLKTDEPIPDYFYVGRLVDACLETVHAKEIWGYAEILEKRGIAFSDPKWWHYGKGLWECRSVLYSHVFTGASDMHIQKPVIYDILNKETGEIIVNDKGRTLRAVGFLDAYDPDMNRITEVKTGDKSRLMEYAFAGQTQLYCLGIVQEYGVGIPDVEYVFIKKPKIRQKKNESIEEFYARMFDEGRRPEVERIPVEYDASTLEETARYLIAVVQDNVEFAPTKNRNECIQYGNKCEYFNHCWPNAFKLPEIKNEEDAA